MSNAKQIEVTILGQQYRLAVQEEAEAALLEAVSRVDAEMSKVRASSTVRGYTAPVAGLVQEVPAGSIINSSLLSCAVVPRESMIVPAEYGSIEPSLWRIRKSISSVLS